MASRCRWRAESPAADDGRYKGFRPWLKARVIVDVKCVKAAALRDSGQAELSHCKVLVEAGEEAGGAAAVGVVVVAELDVEQGFFGADALDY